ncbi:MAG: BdrC1-like protein [Candidatus Kaiserbacteria bacterium GW2011_GWB1_52_6]|uniref:BdrC1-like protein n=2 Tax=Candidatus Kaiseribacteriota TaxID=1752734 RepID=A0A0G1X8H3_9BACT|nr:MAG: BdrC1-like protein [Candidatus Kaiserbacteria bacterium GW2011_GWA2_52_12]KKW27538.1 MAG: BdrC1-like protein [Candidatus Kaiserbacteria bacterium GW2011_GWB1_52_6]
MAPKKTTLNEIGEMVAHVVKHMATKDDITDLRNEIKGVRNELKSDIIKLQEQVAGIEQELKEIRLDLEDIRKKVENITGYRKEIDHAFERIAAIEKHLGIDKKTIPASQG